MGDSNPASQQIELNDSSNEKQEISLSQVVEAILFSSRVSLSVPQIKKISGTKESKIIPTIINELNSFYKENNRSFSIRKVAGGYQLRTDARFKKWIRKGRIVKPIQLSPTVMETLAIVAYQQPVTRADIEGIRTVDATYALRSLLDRKLIKIKGRKEIAGRPILYATTSYFLEVFNFNSLADLPRLEDFDILTDKDNDVKIIETKR